MSVDRSVGRSDARRLVCIKPSIKLTLLRFVKTIYKQTKELTILKIQDADKLFMIEQYTDTYN